MTDRRFKTREEFLAFVAEPATNERAFKFALKRVYDGAWGIDRHNAEQTAKEIIQGTIAELLDAGKDGCPRYETFRGASKRETWFLGVIENHASRWLDERIERRERERTPDLEGDSERILADSDNRDAASDPPEGETETPWIEREGAEAEETPQGEKSSDPRKVPCRYCKGLIGTPGNLRSKHSACLARAREEAADSGALAEAARRAGVVVASNLCADDVAKLLVSHELSWLDEIDKFLDTVLVRWFRTREAPFRPRVWRRVGDDQDEWAAAGKHEKDPGLTRYGRAAPYRTRMDEARLVTRLDLEGVLSPLPDPVLLAVRRYYVEEYDWNEIGAGQIEQMVVDHLRRCRDHPRSRGAESRTLAVFTIACTRDAELPSTWGQLWARLLDAPALLSIQASVSVLEAVQPSPKSALDELDLDLTLPPEAMETLMTFVAERPDWETDDEAAWAAAGPMQTLQSVRQAQLRRGRGRPPKRRGRVSVPEQRLFEEFHCLRAHLSSAIREPGSDPVRCLTRAIMRLDTVKAVLPTEEDLAMGLNSWQPSWSGLSDKRVRAIVQRHLGVRGGLLPLLYALLATPRHRSRDALRNEITRLPTADPHCREFDPYRSGLIGFRPRQALPAPRPPLFNLTVEDPTGHIRDPAPGRSWQLRQLA